MSQDAGDARVTTEDLERSALLRDPAEPWFFFAEGAWGRWFNGLALADDPDAVEFPLAGEVKPEYNVRGCAAVCRCAKTLSALAADETSEVTWSAAAKPFGTVMNFDGGTDVATALKRFVLPCFTDVRLVPLDSVGGEDLATSDIVWVDHLRNHLVRYLEHGPAGSAACWYCRQLQTWENPVFRQTGAIWLKFNSGSCRRGDYGPGGHGGTSHGR